MHGHNRRDALRLAGVVGFAAAAAGLLHRLGALAPFQVAWGDLAGWAAARPPETVVVAGLRLLGLAMAYWVLAGSGVYVAARVSGLPAAVRAVRWAALPPVRRLADRAVAAAVASSGLLASPAAAADVAPPPAVEVYEPTPAGDSVATPEMSPAGIPLPAAPTPVAPTVAPEREPDTPVATGEQPRGHTDGGEEDSGSSTSVAAAAADADEGTSHTVAPGDHLWGVAQQRLAAAWGREPTTAETAAYWREVVAKVTPTLSSGDPNLIYPGETFDLPPTPTPEGEL